MEGMCDTNGIDVSERRCSRIGYWMSEKKCRKLNFGRFGDLCRAAGYELVQLNLEKCLSDQGPFHVILHKVSDLAWRSEEGNLHAKQMLLNFTEFVTKQPEIYLTDPLEGVFTLMNRAVQYNMLRDCFNEEEDVFTPPFMELKSNNVTALKADLHKAGVKYPFVCKPVVANGSKAAHTMRIVFDEQGLKDIVVPSVAQSFITHDAVLKKVFVIGHFIRIVDRPSLKNFDQSECAETIVFNSQDISKQRCNSHLSQLNEADKASAVRAEPPMKTIENLIRKIQARTQLNLLSVDVIIQKHTGKCAVIDVNSFPGYDGVPDFFSLLLDFLQSRPGVLQPTTS